MPTDLPPPRLVPPVEVKSSPMPDTDTALSNLLIVLTILLVFLLPAIIYSFYRWAL